MIKEEVLYILEENFKEAKENNDSDLMFLVAEYCILLFQEHVDNLHKEEAKQMQIVQAQLDARIKCPNCDVGYLTKRDGRYGPFYSCSKYPYCKYTRNAGAGRY